MWTRGYVSTAFGCPYQGPVEPAVVADVAAALRRLGCDQISIGDTIGVGRPDARARGASPRCWRGSPADGSPCTCTTPAAGRSRTSRPASSAGVRVFDSSAGGLGGCPFAPGAPGNLATEALVGFLYERGHETGVDLEALREAGRLGARAVG